MHLGFWGCVFLWKGLLSRPVLRSCTDGGKIIIGNNVSICSGVQLISRGGRIIIGDNAHIGDSVIIVSREEVCIGSDTLLGEYVVIRDQDHSYQTRPIRKSGFESKSIFIGKDVWIGAKATILKGSYIGDGSIVGAHALVNGKIESNRLAVGIPAKEIKSIK